MLNLTCHCSRSGLVVRSSHLTPGEVRPGGLAVAVRGGRGQAALGAVCCPYRPQGPVGSVGSILTPGSVPHSPVPRLFEKYPLTFGAQPGYLCAWELTTSPLLHSS